MTANGRAKPHTWVGATTLLLDSRLAAQAHRSGKLTVVSKLTVEVIDVYCEICRRQYTESEAGTDCRLGPQHIGGPRRQPDLVLVDDEYGGWPPPHDPLA